MNTPRNRREFLVNVGRGTLLATVGLEVATELGLARSLASEPSHALSFGEWEPLVRLMQETPADALLPKLVERMRHGADLRELTAAAALANARTFGGEDYVGFHTMMALAPALHMARELPSEWQPLPVFKVLYRNTHRIQERGGRKDEVLHAVHADADAATEPSACGEALREAVRKKDLATAESIFARSAQTSSEDALNAVIVAVQDDTEVHRAVLPYRAWDLLGLIGKEQAHTLLRQSVHYCVQAESRQPSAGRCRILLPKLLEEHKLLDRVPGTQAVDDAWVEDLSKTFFNSSPEQAAVAAATALADGIQPAAIGEAIALAANQLVLRDQGRRPSEESPGKPPGTVHGDSIGVHASDSANAWRNMARVSNARNTFSCLILGAFQVALDRTNRGGDFLNWKPLPVQYHLDRVKATDPASLLAQLDEAIRGNLQGHAAAVACRHGELGLPARPLFDLLLRYAVSEDGALHAEKFYRTVTEEFAAARPAFRWRYLVGLARVTASEYGRPAPGLAEARSLLKV